MEQQIIGAILSSRKAYDQISGHFDPKKTLSPIGQFWYELLDEYYKRDAKASQADLVILRGMAESRLGSHKQKDAVLGLLDGIDKLGSATNVVASILDLRRNTLCLELASALTSNKRTQADKIFRELADVWDRQTLGRESQVQHTGTLEDLFDSTDNKHRVRLFPLVLADRACGGALPGHHIGVFGRTEVGKSTFVRNMCAGFIYDKHKVLYVANEDSLSAHQLRFISRVTRKTGIELANNVSIGIAKFRELGGEDYLRIVHMQPGSVSAIQKEVEAYEPKILVIDQIRNLDGGEDGITAKMESNAIRVRNLLSEYGLVGVSVTQAGDRSSGHHADSPIWLSAGDVDSSRVGFPATVDLLLGVGGNAQMLSRGQRAISICKNKLAADSRSREGFICNFNLETGVVS